MEADKLHVKEDSDDIETCLDIENNRESSKLEVFFVYEVHKPGLDHQQNTSQAVDKVNGNKLTKVLVVFLPDAII